MCGVNGDYVQDARFWRASCCDLWWAAMLVECMQGLIVLLSLLNLLILIVNLR